MDEMNYWRLFLNSGSVLDYIAYKQALEAKNTGADTVSREDTDEIPNRGLGNQGTEYR